MQDEQKRRVETLFHASLARTPGTEREAFLDGACGNDAALRERVEALIVAHEESTGFLEDPAVASTREGLGSSIGPYKLLQEIGEGGMGVVYMAEQEQPVRRKVALKVIKLGMDTKQVIARFEAERQALAMMEHEHIARVLDAGSTESGRPYFVMELVRGVPINDYCDTHKLATKERLALFVDVCRAVQHAHQKGIIHRDLKPTNVLVTSHDGRPVPKIIDFGVAKATNQKLTERTLFTEFRQIIGTPEYMSPEQAEMSGLDVDTRSDIYALGVLMYQLLTGTTPVDPTDLRTAGFEEMTRMIREDEPPSPSTRISKLGGDAEAIAKNRASDAGSLSRLLQGDLDWIVMKALEKDRTRRYETAAAFAEDVSRHLEDRPVEAGPPGTRYRLMKFVRRNKNAVAAGLVLAGVLGLGLLGTTAGFLRARSEAERSLRMSASLQDVLAMTDAARATDREDVEGVLQTVREVFGEEHATYAAVLDTLAMRLHDAGDLETAEGLCRESLEVWKGVYGEDHANVGGTLHRLGETLHARGKDEEAEQAYRGAIAIFARDTEANSSHGMGGYEARVRLADLLANRGAYAEADELLGEALDLLRASPSPVHFRIIETLELRTVVQVNRPESKPYETLGELYEEAQLFYPPESPMLAMVALGYGRSLAQNGEEERAMPYLREAVERFQASPKAPRFYCLVALEILFQILRGRADEASVLETDALLAEMNRVAREFWSPEELSKNLRYYASRMVDRGKVVEGIDAALEANQILFDGGFPVDERDSLRGDLLELAFLLVLSPDREPDAYARARRAAEVALREMPEHPIGGAILGASLYRQGEYETAAALLEGASEDLKTASGSQVRKIGPVVYAFAALAHARLGETEQARSELAELRAAFERGTAGGAEGAALIAEVEALLREPAPSVEGD